MVWTLLAPPHDGGVPYLSPSVHYIVPGNQLAPFFRDDAGHFPEEPALDVLDVLDVLALHQGLDVWIVVPASASEIDFVAADVNIFAGKQGEDLIQHVVDEPIDLVAAHVECKQGVRILWIQSPHQPGVCPASRRGVSRHVEFRNYFDMALGGVGHYLPYLLLGIELRRSLGVRVATRRSDRRKFGIFLYLDPPAWCVREMPVELVQLVISHKVQGLQDIFLSEKMP